MTEDRGRGIPVLVLLLPVAGVAAVMAVLFARALFEIPVTAAFFETYPGDATAWEGTPVGFPAWLSWTPFLSAFFFLFIVRSGLLVRGGTRPPAFVTRRAAGATRLSLHTWWHLVIDVLWVANGLARAAVFFCAGAAAAQQASAVAPSSNDLTIMERYPLS